MHFDPAKDAINRAKHGVSLTLAQDWDTALVWPDEREAYGEERECAIGYIGLRLFYVVFVDRADGRHVISLRKANTTERNRYAAS